MESWETREGRCLRSQDWAVPGSTGAPAERSIVMPKIIFDGMTSSISFSLT